MALATHLCYLVDPTVEGHAEAIVNQIAGFGIETTNGEENGGHCRIDNLERIKRVIIFLDHAEYKAEVVENLLTIQRNLTGHALA